jgi:hypothetical protein
VKTISRNEAEFTRERKVDLVRMQRNADPAQHPFEKPREYTRALNAVKMDKIFARPFVAALNGHSDSVFSLCRHPDSLTHVFSGSCDGGNYTPLPCARALPVSTLQAHHLSLMRVCAELKVWNLSTRVCLTTLPAHRGFVRGIALGHDNTSVITVGDDKTIKLWPLSLDALRNGLPEDIQVCSHAHRALAPLLPTSHYVCVSSLSLSPAPHDLPRRARLLGGKPHGQAAHLRHLRSGHPLVGRDTRLAHRHVRVGL